MLGELLIALLGFSNVRACFFKEIMMFFDNSKENM
jgi:hypothetical protein